MAVSRGLVVVPLLLSIAGFALTMVALFAGSKPGQMEEYHIIALNMSDFGHDLVPTPTTGGSQPTTTDSGGIGGFFSSVAASIASEIGDELNDIENDIADKLSAKLGISQWYSLHIMDSCEGNFAPNATSPGAWYNTTNCTAQQPGFQLNISQILDHEIEIGPLDLNPADLQLPDAITDAVNAINAAMLAIFIFFVLGIAFSGLEFLACIATLSLGTDRRFLSLFHIILFGLAALTIGIGSAITTAVAKKGEQEINDKGADAGISATAGGKFMIITWVAFGANFVGLVFWIFSACTGRRTRSARSSDPEKLPRGSRDSARPMHARSRNPLSKFVGRKR